MTCWNGHIPRMNTDQMRQAVDAYIRAYERSFEARWQTSPFVHDLEWHTPAPRLERKSRTDLHEARPGDKVDAIDVEFERLR